jgi:PAS domain S-box-containing protein
MIGSISDITGRKRAEETLRISEAKYRTLIENIPQKIFMKDRNYRWVSINENLARDLGLRPEEVVGKADADLFPAELAAKYHTDDMRIMETGKTEDIEEKYIQEGRETWVNTIKTPVRDASGVIVGVLGVFWDITERKRAEEALERIRVDLVRSNKELEQFAYVASHDLQEPLRMVSSYTQLLAQKYEGQLDEKAKKYINYAVDGAVRMQRLINDLLTYSRISTRGKPSELIDSHSVLGEALRNLAATIEENRAVITNEDLPMVRADESQLMQVFQNLIANAIKFRQEELPQIHVSVREQEREWVFSVKDNGIGIDPKYSERLFVIFQRLHTKEEYPGTGIGLAVCKRIAERHGGRIWFESELGKGTKFYFTIPK